MDRYVRIRMIGEGSFGKALLVKHKESNKQFVIKEINMVKMSPKEREEARKETAVLAQLKHPNIVTYMESFEEKGDLYIVMDYCDGGDLYGRINSQKGALLPEEQVLDWFVQTCLAIKHIHDRKILHRDIKSQNIFLTRHGIVKLGDFGIAKVLNSTVDLARTCIGTPYYLSPEICENKPYNNKSDIWSLGCVLYELTTLKHAFESHNMKNLVLKIIQGSYPQPSPRYSSELRNLISTLFRRNPRDRPSINSILKMRLLQNKIKKFLSESELAEEFSHTVMHGVQIKKKIPVGGPHRNVVVGGARPLPPAPRPAPTAGRKAPAPSPVSVFPRYDPSQVYGQPVVKRRPPEQDRKTPGQRRPQSAASNRSSGELRKQEMLQKEHKRREEAKKSSEDLQAKHLQLNEKMRQARVNKQREQAWRDVLSPAAMDIDKKDEVSQKDTDSDEPPQGPAQPRQEVPPKDRPIYAEYHAYLDKLKEDRRNNPPGPDGFDPVAASERGVRAAAQGAKAGDRARVVNEFVQRKQAAAINKARAQGDLFAGARPALQPGLRQHLPETPVVEAPSYNVYQKAVVEPKKDQPSEDYLARLKQIRMQNFNNRRNVVAQQGEAALYKPPAGADDVNEIRRKKIEALRAQADDRAKRLMADLQRKREEAVNPRPVAPVKPVPITQALNAIGASPQPHKMPVFDKAAVGLTAALNALELPSQGQEVTEVKVTEPDVKASLDDKSEVQRKREILKRVNSKFPPSDTGKEDPVEEPSSRSVWKQPQHLERPSVWGEKVNMELLGQAPLEQTATQMEETNSQLDFVVRHDNSRPPSANNRRQWGQGRNTVINALSKAALTSTVTQDNVNPAPSPSHSPRPLPVPNVPSEPLQPGLSKTPLGATVTLHTGGSSSKEVVLNRPVILPANQQPVVLPANQQPVVLPANQQPVLDVASKGRAPSPKPPTPGTSPKKTSPQAESSPQNIKNTSPTPGRVKSTSPSPPSIKNTSPTPGSIKSTSPSPGSIKQTSPTPPTIKNTSPVPPTIKNTSPVPFTKGSSSPDGASKSPSDNTKSTNDSPKDMDEKMRDKTVNEIVDQLEQVFPNQLRATLMTCALKHWKPNQSKDLLLQMCVNYMIDNRTHGEREQLFNRVELDDDDEDEAEGDHMVKLEVLSMQDLEDDSRSSNDDSLKKSAGVVFGLTTGNFDIDCKMLRTCSEPDLSKLFSTRMPDNPFFADDVNNGSFFAPNRDDGEEDLEAHNEDSDEGDEDDDDDIEALYNNAMSKAEEVDDQETNEVTPDTEEEEEEDGLVYSLKDIPTDSVHRDELTEENPNSSFGNTEEDDSELETVRASMADLLQKSTDDEPLSVSKEVKVKDKSVKVKDSDSKTSNVKARRKRREKQAAEGKDLAKGPPSSLSNAKMNRPWSASSVEDFRNMRETMKSLVTEDKEGVKAKPRLAPVAEVTDSAAAGGDANSSVIWQSDDDADDEVDDDYWEEDMFSRLEETRAQLEQQLGCETFLKAYKAVQAIHEDEDESMEDGMRLVSHILGQERLHLYPKILQLVMADGVWTEDNE